MSLFTSQTLAWIRSKFVHRKKTNRLRKLTYEVLESRELLAQFTTIAGGGLNAGIAAAAAIVPQPQFLATDSVGNLYFSDDSLQCIRVIDHTTGMISTFAGTGLQTPNSSDKRLATATPLNNPGSLAFDKAGDLFFIDNTSTTLAAIREVNHTTHIVTTIWGAFNNPQALALDSVGNIYIADQSGNQIREIDSTFKTISNFAGQTTAGSSGDAGPASAAFFNGISSLKFDANNNLYVADSVNNRVRKIDNSSHKVSTVAGNGVPGFLGENVEATAAQLSFPAGLTLDSTGNYLFIADKGNNRVRRVQLNLAHQLITTYAGGGSILNGDGGAATLATLNFPTDVAIDTTGNLFIADNGANRIREVDATTKLISTYAGTGKSLFIGDNLAATQGRLVNPEGVAVDAAGDVYIADTDHNLIREILVNSQTIVTIAGTGTPGSSSDNIPATGSNLNHPTSIAVDADGNVFFTDSGNNLIQEIRAADGIILTLAGTGVAGYSGDTGSASAAQLNDPEGIALDVHGNIFFSDSKNNRIREILIPDSFGVQKILTIAGTGTKGFAGDMQAASAALLNTPTAVTVDSVGNIYFSDAGNHRIRRVDRNSLIITTIAGKGTLTSSGDGGDATAAGLNSPTGLALDSLGNLFMIDAGNVREVFDVTKVIGTIYTNSNFSALIPFGITLDSNNNLFVSDQRAGLVKKIFVDPSSYYTILNQHLAITADNGDHQVVFQRSIIDPTITQVSINGLVRYSIKNTSFVDVSVQLGNGTNSFTINADNGNPIPGGGLDYQGGTGANTLVAPNSTNVWNITGANTGTLNNSITFSHVAYLTGGSSYDTFIIQPTGSLAGGIDGRGGRNAIDYSNFLGQITSSLVTHSSTAIGNNVQDGVLNIQDFIGNSSGKNFFVGPVEINKKTTWNISAANTGNLDLVGNTTAYTFRAFSNLFAGSYVQSKTIFASVLNIFKLSANGSLDYLDGSLGPSQLDYSAYGARVIVSLRTSAATGFKNLVGGGLNRIQSIIGSSDPTNLLVGYDDSTAWTITGANAGTIGKGTFSGFASITGGNGNDSFAFTTTGSLAGTLDGGLGSNTIDYSKDTNPVVFSILNNATTAVHQGSGNRVYRFQNFVGNNTSSLLVGPSIYSVWNLTSTNSGDLNGTTIFKNFTNLTGSAGNDELRIAANARLTGYFDGGTGSNTVNYTKWTADVVVNLPNFKATGLGHVYDVQNILSGAGNDTLTGVSQGGIIDGGAGNDTITGGDGRSILIGGAGNDFISGGIDDDIMIGGTTGYDNSISALLALWTEWQQSGVTYANRIAHIRQGTGLTQGYNFVLGNTVKDDGAQNVLLGETTTPLATELNWYFANLNLNHDSITQHSGEVVN